MLNTAILGVGSNYQPEKHMQQAAIQLAKLFPDIRFSRPVYTVPENMRNPDLFLNRAALFHTPTGLAEVRHLLKQIETCLGRTPEDKQKEQIVIDIDLVKWNDLILKPADFERAYLTEGIRRLTAGQS